ncbi:MAG TPA: HEAT repeat domain-containing protein [Blastocatellia bacterium]|nr:HEAT repeat domain-containing protein [Blastocatellia bacterium]
MSSARFKLSLLVLLAPLLICGHAEAQPSSQPSTAPARLLSDLKSKDADTRMDAANELGALRARNAVRALVEALSDKEARVREASAFALGQITDQASTALLVPLLADKDASVRASTAFALGMIGERKAANALSYALADPQAEVRSSVLVAMGLMQDEEGVDEIIDALDDESFDVRYDAVWALGQIGEPDAEERLRGALVSVDALGLTALQREAFRLAVQDSLARLRTDDNASPSGRPRRATGIVKDTRYSAPSKPLVVRQEVRPPTTEKAFRSRVNGFVGLRVLVGADGRSVRAYVTRRLGSGLDQRAVQAAMLYKFEPAMEGGLPQTTWVDLKIRF